jgi:hypothetical protein
VCLIESCRACFSSAKPAKFRSCDTLCAWSAVSYETRYGTESAVLLVGTWSRAPNAHSLGGTYAGHTNAVQVSGQRSSKDKRHRRLEPDAFTGAPFGTVRRQERVSHHWCAYDALVNAYAWPFTDATNTACLILVICLGFVLISWTRNQLPCRLQMEYARVSGESCAAPVSHTRRKPCT